MSLSIQPKSRDQRWEQALRIQQEQNQAQAFPAQLAPQPGDVQRVAAEGLITFEHGNG